MFKHLIYNFLFLIVFVCNELVRTELLGDILQMSKLEDALGLKKDSKLSLFDMLSGALGRTPDGGFITEGDIVLYGQKRKGVKPDGDLWPDGVIPYDFDKSVDEDHRNLLEEAMQHWEDNTCLHFRKKNKKDSNYMYFRSDYPGCWSSVGRLSHRKGGQDISIGPGCYKFYTAVHEIGHTIGYFHEHARKDRDDYIYILWGNVKPGMKIQFDKQAFSKSPVNKSVIVARNPFLQYLIDEERDHLSFRDIKLTNMLYNCSQKCPNFKTTQCVNEGYLSPNKTSGKNCTCLCPTGFTGKLCEIGEEAKKIDYKGPKCGGNITEEGTFSTPNYPVRKNPHESCAYWIRAPINHRAEVTFEDFSFAEPHKGDNKPELKGLCMSESVELRYHSDIYDGSLFCGQQIKPKTVMKSGKRDFIIIIIADDKMRGRGLKVKVRFIEEKNNPLVNKEEKIDIDMRIEKNQKLTKLKARKNVKQNNQGQSQDLNLLQGIKLK